MNSVYRDPIFNQRHDLRISNDAAEKTSPEKTEGGNAEKALPRSESATSSLRQDSAPTPSRFLAECGISAVTPLISGYSEVNPFEASFANPNRRANASSLDFSSSAALSDSVALRDKSKPPSAGAENYHFAGLHLLAEESVLTPPLPVFVKTTKKSSSNSTAKSSKENSPLLVKSENLDQTEKSLDERKTMDANSPSDENYVASLQHTQARQVFPWPPNPTQPAYADQHVAELANSPYGHRPYEHPLSQLQHYPNPASHQQPYANMHSTFGGQDGNIGRNGYAHMRLSYGVPNPAYNQISTNSFDEQMSPQYPHPSQPIANLVTHAVNNVLSSYRGDMRAVTNAESQSRDQFYPDKGPSMVKVTPKLLRGSRKRADRDEPNSSIPAMRVERLENGLVREEITSRPAASSAYSSMDGNNDRYPNGGSHEDETSEGKRQRFLERNRMAASKCRQKKKLWVESLEHQAEEISATNKNLNLLVGQLKEEVLNLKSQLLSHRNCDCNVIHQYVQQSGQLNHLNFKKIGSFDGERDLSSNADATAGGPVHYANLRTSMAHLTAAVDMASNEAAVENRRGTLHRQC